MKRIAPLLLLALLACSCVSGKRPVLREPRDSLDAMRAAFERDDSGLFIHTLASPVLKRYSEYVIRLGWGEIRPNIGGLVARARLVEVEAYTTVQPDDVGGSYVWPKGGVEGKRARLQVDGEWEDFLFVHEVDPAPENAKQATGFWVGDRYYIRREHDSPETYMTEDAPEKDRTHWRLVFPYYPFQREGKLGLKLQQEMARERKAPEKKDK
ncbi:MAG: hypothetical protein IT462_17580 [Planctomycetes bacterium]|nr:hypothetical protein [Planctomycetota bacterium]